MWCAYSYDNAATLSSKSRRTRSCPFLPRPVATRSWFRSIADSRWLIFLLFRFVFFSTIYIYTSISICMLDGRCCYIAIAGMLAYPAERGKLTDPLMPGNATIDQTRMVRRVGRGCWIVIYMCVYIKRSQQLPWWGRPRLQIYII